MDISEMRASEMKKSCNNYSNKQSNKFKTNKSMLLLVLHLMI